MAKKKSMKRPKGNAAKFSLKPLHLAFAKTEAQLKLLPQTGSAKRLAQDLTNAVGLLLCDQSMLRDLTKA